MVNDPFELSTYQRQHVYKAKLDPEAKKKWVEALRSGNYQQGEGALKADTEDGLVYCCLGVLCEIMVNDKAWQLQETSTGPIYGLMNRNTAYLPDFIRDEVFNHTADASIDMILAQANDAGASFDEIADWIEENL